MLEPKIHMVLDRLSNGESDTLEIKDEWIEEATENFRQALKKQFGRTSEPFRLRMSNLGKPTCQLQMEKMGKPKSRLPYNFIMRMLLGDASESLILLLLKISKANITSEKDKVEMSVLSTKIEGETDLDIDGKVYDIKSASPWSFSHKFSEGYEGLRDNDDFGYISQLIGYSNAQNKEVGGWIVLDKSSGCIKVIDAEVGAEEKKRVTEDIKQTVETVMSDAPFKRMFEPEDEYFRKALTGSKRLSTTCAFCPYLQSCYPNAQLLPQTGSKAQNPKHYWYTEYKGEVL